MISGKNAVITGANRGIGLATVEVFAKHGANIFACCRAESKEFEDRLSKISCEYHVNIQPVYFDITDEESVKFSVKDIGKKCASIDILVNNAGISVERLLGMTPLALVRKTMDVNYLAQIQMAQLISRYMMKQKSGSIVNVASVSGLLPEKGGIAYGSSKAAVIYATCTLALELASYGIRVNAVSPGFIDTDMWKDRNADIKEQIESNTPLHRQGRPEEVANTILFLASDLASYITGQNIIVDGGRKMGGMELSSMDRMIWEAMNRER